MIVLRACRLLNERTGHALAIASGLGVSPWTTLAQGIALQTHWSIGTAVLVLGLVVLALNFTPVRERPIAFIMIDT